MWLYFIAKPLNCLIACWASIESVYGTFWDDWWYWSYFRSNVVVFFLYKTNCCSMLISFQNLMSRLCFLRKCPLGWLFARCFEVSENRPQMIRSVSQRKFERVSEWNQQSNLASVFWNLKWKRNFFTQELNNWKKKNQTHSYIFFSDSKLIFIKNLHDPIKIGRHFTFYRFFWSQRTVVNARDNSFRLRILPSFYMYSNCVKCEWFLWI